MSNFVATTLLILAVIAIFNITIFVHELGHFLAARWRGLKVDRFQIWFGKPIWKKEINGVQYGLGWIPAGGFVALPQMAAMESIEGSNLGKDSLPKVKPIDKIIVAFAGPLFSLLLALTAALAVWGLGKPQNFISSNIVGAIDQKSPAAEVLKVGDEILKVDGHPVENFRGDVFDDIATRIMITEGEFVEFEIKRDGKIQTIQAPYYIQDTKPWQRRALPRVGIGPSTPAVIGSFVESKNQTPAQRAGLQLGDQITAIDGQPVFSPTHAGQLLDQEGKTTFTLTVLRNGQNLEIPITPLKPVEPKDERFNRPMIGIDWDRTAQIETRITNPTPFKQVGDSIKMMGLTIKTITSPKSKVGVDQLAGPIGIAKTKFLLLLEDDGWLKVLAFFVFFNVNLAIMNMLPVPVLDGGHILMSLYEWIRGKALPQKFLEFTQTAFALLIMGFMLFITTKDIGDEIPTSKPPQDPGEFVWPE